MRIAQSLAFPVRVLKLEKIILSKGQVNRDKDRSTLDTLRRALRLRGEAEQGSPRGLKIV